MTTTPRKNQFTILVVDDDKDIVQTIKGNLELDGYRVLCAYDGRSGLDLTRANRPDLVILDLNLPDIDGIKACEVMRREFSFPIIMLTARDSISDKVLGLESGADDYMVKPFNYLELSARIRSLFKRVGRSMVKDRYQLRDISINFKSRSVIVRGKDVKLTKMEYDLLELFITYPNEALSRAFIKQQIWKDSQLYRHSRAVDVHVQRLRKKIEKDIEHPKHINTVAGVGYKFQTE